MVYYLVYYKVKINNYLVFYKFVRVLIIKELFIIYNYKLYDYMFFIY